MAPAQGSSTTKELAPATLNHGKHIPCSTKMTKNTLRLKPGNGNILSQPPTLIIGPAGDIELPNNADPQEEGPPEPEPDREPPDKPPDPDDCNDVLRESHPYKREAQPSCYNQAITFLCTLLIRTIIDTPAAKKLRNYKSPESLEDKEPPDRPPDILEDKDEGEQRATRGCRPTMGWPWAHHQGNLFYYATNTNTDVYSPHMWIKPGT